MTDKLDIAQVRNYLTGLQARITAALNKLDGVSATVNFALEQAATRGRPRLLLSAHGLPKKTVARCVCPRKSAARFPAPSAIRARNAWCAT